MHWLGIKAKKKIVVVYCYNLIMHVMVAASMGLPESHYYNVIILLLNEYRQSNHVHLFSSSPFIIVM